MKVILTIFFTILIYVTNTYKVVDIQIDNYSPRTNLYLETILEIPSISLKTIVDNEKTYTKPWYWKYSQRPTDSSHLVVISGHSFSYSNPFNSPFYDLELLDVGDEIYVYYDESVYLYIVNDISIVKPNISNILNGDNSTNIIIYTCYPKYISTHRLVLRGTLVSVDNL